MTVCVRVTPSSDLAAYRAHPLTDCLRVFPIFQVAGAASP
jgi:hypothetical protein